MSRVTHTGLTRRVPTLGGGAAWSPLVFGDALQGWFDASDLTTLFQDVAGTTPATAEDNPIGRWADKSGKNHHITQATAANQMLLKLAQQNGLPAVRGDGSNDLLAFSGAGLNMFKGVAYGYVFAVYNPRQIAASPRYAVWWSTVVAGTTRLTFGDGTMAQRFNAFARRLDADGVLSITSNTDHGGTTNVIGLMAEWAAGTLKLRQNGVEVASGAFAGSGSTSDTASGSAVVGSGGGLGGPSLGNHCEYIMIARATPLTADEITAIETYLDDKWAVF